MMINHVNMLNDVNSLKTSKISHSIWVLRKSNDGLIRRDDMIVLFPSDTDAMSWYDMEKDIDRLLVDEQESVDAVTVAEYLAQYNLLMTQAVFNQTNSG